MSSVRRVRHVIRQLATLALVAACASDTIGPPAGLPYAAATPACGPADGPAIAIYLAPSPVASLDPAAPFVLIHVWQPLERLTDRSWRLADADAIASYFSTPNDAEAATGGSVMVTVIDPDSTIRGSAVLNFPTRGTIAGGFRARWIPLALRCG